MLGAEKVEGVKATGDNVCRTFLRIMTHNHHSISLLEHVEMDGGSNFKGKKKGFIAWLLKLPDIGAITRDHCFIHRYFFFFFSFFFFFLDCCWL
jgi:hypothetical protein